MSAGIDDSERPRLRLLIDTNVFIAIEPSLGQVESGFGPGAQLLRLVNRQGHRLFVHPATRDDLRENRTAAQRSHRLLTLEKFDMLDEVPMPTALTTLVGTSAAGSNDERDLRLLAALHAHAVTYLVSDDAGLRRRAGRAGLADAVLTLAEATALLASFEPRAVPPPPRVERIPSYGIDVEQPIFASLRADYPGFDDWLDRVRADSDNRDCYVVRDDSGAYEALALVKRREPDCEYAFDQPVAKIATFKVDEAGAGRRYGELLLKAVLAALHGSGVASLYVEVLPKHRAVVDFLLDFGFEDRGAISDRGEHVLVKTLRPAATARTLDPLDYHVRYGPPALLLSGRVYLVPIEPVWHEQLFPDAPSADDQMLLPGLAVERTHPWGNALRKAYLCNSNATGIEPGDTLLFYRSEDAQAVTAVGVVESTVRSQHSEEIVSHVGQRTVYTPAQIATMCRSVRGVLAIVFRQDRFIEPPWSRSELQREGVVTAWPQSITEVHWRGLEWVRDRLSG